MGFRQPGQALADLSTGTQQTHRETPASWHLQLSGMDDKKQDLLVLHKRKDIKQGNGTGSLWEGWNLK